MSHKPTVTVWMNSYNHEKFVAQAIESVLAQKNVDFEFLIADDGSSDNTQKIIESFSDKRIKFFPHKANRGACVVTNELIQMASGEYLAKINSDDAWIGDDKLEHQLQIMRDNPALGACFGRPRFMDEDGREIDKNFAKHYKIFSCVNGSQAQWLRYFFQILNFPCQPTLMIKKECFDKIGLYDNRLRQFPDLEFWLRLVKHYPIHVADREMIYYRVLPGDNTSTPTVENIRRAHNEQYIIFRSYFDDVNPALLLEAFPDFIKFKDFPSAEHVDIEKALLYFIPHPNTNFETLNHMNGLCKLFDLLNSEKHRKVLEQDYHIDDLWFQKRMSEVGVFDSFGLVEREEVLADLYASRSWRLTKPFRTMSDVLRSLKNAIA